MHYSDSEIVGTQESSLLIYRYNTDTSAWTALTNCSVDISANIVTCDTNHFSIFGIFGETQVTSSGGGGGGGSYTPTCRVTSHLKCKQNIDGAYVYFKKSGKSCRRGDLGKSCSIDVVETEVVEPADAVTSSGTVVEETPENEITSENPVVEIPKTKEINGEIKEYALAREFNSCQKIDDLLNVEFTTDFDTSLLDITDSDQKNLIERLEKAGVVSGTLEDNFEGNRKILRTEFLKFVLRSHCLEYREEDTSTLDFTDLDNSTWQAKVIKKSVELGIAVGDVDENGNKVFRANDVISSIEATKILMRMALIQEGEEPDTSYTDLTAEWQNKYVQQGEHLGIFSAENDNNLFNPNEGIDRNRTVDFLFKVIKLYR